MLTNPVFMRRFEAFAIFVLGLLAYHHFDYGWGMFALLFFLPDAGAAGYFFNHKAGSTMYNLTHWKVWPLMLGAYGLSTDHDTAKMVAIIWITHIAFDRMLGWGFKTGGSFYQTDMGEKRDPRKKQTAGAA